MGKTYSSKIKEVNIRPNFCREKNLFTYCTIRVTQRNAVNRLLVT